MRVASRRARLRAQQGALARGAEGRAFGGRRTPWARSCACGPPTPGVRGPLVLRTSFNSKAPALPALGRRRVSGGRACTALSGGAREWNESAASCKRTPIVEVWAPAQRAIFVQAS